MIKFLRKLKINLRSFIAADDSEFKIEVANRNKLNLPYVITDGKREYKLKKGDYLIVKKSSRKTLFCRNWKE